MLKRTFYSLLTLTILFGFSGCSKQADQTPSAPNISATDSAEHGVVPSHEDVDFTPEEIVVIPSEESLIPFNSSWNYPQILNRRPGNQLLSGVNPPRFSWPYVITTVQPDPFNLPIKPTVFTLQIARSADFSDLVFDVIDTPYNFYNALPVLETGTYYWRVGYGANPNQEWSDAWSFSVNESSVSWDRTVILQAVDLLSSKERPRSGPPNGDWDVYNEWLQTTEATALSYNDLVTEADRVIELPWWNNLPDTDVVEYTNRESKTKWVGYLKNAVTVAYVYRLTGDRKYRDSLENILHMARWPRGGGLSPEALGGSTKMPSQAAELFAVVYDWFYYDMTSMDLLTLEEAVSWRLNDMYFDKDNIIWNQAGERMQRYGMAYAFGSHPYQNYTWSLPAILLMAGDSEEADRLVPMALHYLTGVTSPEGAEEGYNEGHGYSNEKGGTMLKAALVTDLLLPELEIGKNPLIEGFVDWMIFMFPGAERLPWGDSWMTTARGVGGSNLRYAAYMSGSADAKLMWEERANGQVADLSRGLYSRPWFDLLAYGTYRSKVESLDGELSADSLFLKEAGWAFVQSQPIENFADYYETIGMQMQMRPKGGYSHSYPSDGSFVWYAYGQLLSCGGGWRSWASMDYCRDPISQNTLVINGRGHQSVNRYEPQVPYMARPLAFEEGEGYTYWSADLTSGYFNIDGVERVHRHVVFLDKEHFVIYDDLKLDASAEPSQFSWLFHIYQNTPVEINEGSASFNYQIGSVFAKVSFANNPESIDISNLIGRDAYVNPFTGHDAYPIDMERAASRSIFTRPSSQALVHNNLWVTSSVPSNAFQFLSVLTASKGDTGSMPTLNFVGEKKVILTYADGTRRSVSFDPSQDADIVIDVDGVRAHAESE